MVSREWIWFFKADIDDTDLNEAQVTRYLEHKIKQYKLQDMKAEREIDNKNILMSNGYLTGETRGHPAFAERAIRTFKDSLYKRVQKR